MIGQVVNAWVSQLVCKRVRKRVSGKGIDWVGDVVSGKGSNSVCGWDSK